MSIVRQTSRRTYVFLIVALLTRAAAMAWTGHELPRVPDKTQANPHGSGAGSPVCEQDVDGDGVPNQDDNCSNVPNMGQQDADGDGLGDSCDLDRDGDGIDNWSDNCPDAPNPAQENGDGDFYGDACDDDFDNDGLSNDVDNCPTMANGGQEDTDGDGAGDDCDDDADSDGVPNAADNCSLDANPEQADYDSDGIGDQCEATALRFVIGHLDASLVGRGRFALSLNGVSLGDYLTTNDYDGLCSQTPLIVSFTDSDTLLLLGHDRCNLFAVTPVSTNVFSYFGIDYARVEVDYTNGRTASTCLGYDWLDCSDRPACSWNYQAPIANIASDLDGDGRPDCLEVAGDDDGDGAVDGVDNCPSIRNSGQDDADGDGVGDVCDSDRDGDGILDEHDNCLGLANAGQEDSDSDGVGDPCDNCLCTANFGQADLDADGQGDVCDQDQDDDGVPDASDRCPRTPDGDQQDAGWGGHRRGLHG